MTTGAGVKGRAGDRWVRMLCVVVVIAIFWTLWAFYAKIHTEDRYVQQPAGAAATVQGQTFRVLSMVATDTLVSDGGAEPQVAAAGSTFVVARVEVETVADTQYPACSLPLLGRDGRSWEPTFPDVTRPDAYRSCGDAKAGVAQVFEQIYEINASDASSLFGLVIENPASPAEVAVISAP